MLESLTRVMCSNQEVNITERVLYPLHQEDWSGAIVKTIVKASVKARLLTSKGGGNALPFC